MILSKHRGRLIIHHQLINENPALISMIFQKLIPIAAVNTPDDEIVYTAISPEFAEIKVGDPLPLYFVEITKDSEGHPMLSFKEYKLNESSEKKGSEDGPEDTRI